MAYLGVVVNDGVKVGRRGVVSQIGLGVVVDLHGTVAIAEAGRFVESGLAIGHGAHQTALVDERDQHHRLPLLLLAVLVRLAV